MSTRGPRCESHGLRRLLGPPWRDRVAGTGQTPWGATDPVGRIVRRARGNTRSLRGGVRKPRVRGFWQRRWAEAIDLRTHGTSVCLWRGVTGEPTLNRRIRTSSRSRSLAARIREEAAQAAGRAAPAAGVGQAQGPPGHHRLRGPRHRRQGWDDPRAHRAGQPARVPPRRAAGAVRPREDGDVHAAVPRALPAAGEIVVFDRSWYNRAGVERVMGFCTQRQYEAIPEPRPTAERWIVNAGIQLIKLWLEVGPDEQERRMTARIDDPLRRWKLSPMDLKSWPLWYDYSRARDRDVRGHRHQVRPWHILRSDDKRRARLNIISHLLDQIPYESPPRESPLPFPRVRSGAATASPTTPPVHPSAVLAPCVVELQTECSGARRIPRSLRRLRSWRFVGSVGRGFADHEPVVVKAAATPTISSPRLASQISHRSVKPASATGGHAHRPCAFPLRVEIVHLADRRSVSCAGQGRAVPARIFGCARRGTRVRANASVRAWAEP